MTYNVVLALREAAISAEKARFRTTLRITTDGVEILAAQGEAEHMGVVDWSSLDGRPAALIDMIDAVNRAVGMTIDAALQRSAGVRPEPKPPGSFAAMDRLAPRYSE